MQAPPSRASAALDANALELFARIVAAGSFAQAAREQGLTRAAVSRRVATIEAQLGVPLFTRTTRALGLSEAGRRLLVRARAVHEAAEQARHGFRRGAVGDAGTLGLGGTLRITSVPSFAQVVLAPLLAHFQARHPALRMELRLTHRRMDLLRDDVDVAFRLTAKPPQDWVATPVMHLVVRAYAAPRRGLPLTSPRALTRERCLVFGPPAEEAPLTWRRDGDAAAAPSTVTVEPTLTADDLGTLQAAAEAGRGVVFLPDFMAQRALREQRLIDALPGWHLVVPEGETAYALTLPMPESPEAARVLVRFVRDELGRARARDPGRRKA